MGERQSRMDRATFWLRVTGLQVLRAWRDIRYPVTLWSAQNARISEGCSRIELRSALFIETRSEELAYESGKIENLRVAARRLNGLTIPAHGIFSFWRQVGRASARRGFVTGRMLQLGCVVPAVGGGLCQLSNALYQLALEAGCIIVERHAHSKRLPGTPLPNATVAWNYIDLRFRVPVETRLEVALTRTELLVAFLSNDSRTMATTLRVLSPRTSRSNVEELPTCGTCDQVDCVLHEAHDDFTGA